MREYWNSIFKFLKIYFIFHLLFWLFLLIISRETRYFDELFIIWFGLTVLMPIFYGWYLVLLKGDQFEGAYRIIFHINMGEPFFTLFLLILFLGCFSLFFYGGWNLIQYLHQNRIILNELNFLIMVGSAVFAFLVSFSLLLKLSDYLYLHGY
jgi:hypothetical protein